MKNTKILNIICALILFLIIITGIYLSILGNKTRIGYLTNLDLNLYSTLELNNIDIDEVENLFTIDNILNKKELTNYVLTNELIRNYNYNFRVGYYSKVFRNSDIYSVHIDTNKVIQDNDFITEIKMSGEGSPFGNLVSKKQIDFDKINNIEYTLKPKIYKFLVILLVLSLIIYFEIKIKFISNIFAKIKNYSFEYISYENNSSYLENILTNRIKNILFVIYIIILSAIFLSTFFIFSFSIDDWIYSSTYHAFYQIFDFKGYFWQRGRHFADILMSINMRPFGNIFISFGLDPLFTNHIFISIFSLIFYYITLLALYLFIWILNDKKHSKLIFISISLYLFIIIVTMLADYISLSAYIASAGFGILTWLPMLYYFKYEKEFIFFNNRIFHYSLFLFLIYLATFTIEPTSLTISGLSFFMIMYFLNIKNKIFMENNSKKIPIQIFVMLLLFCVGSISSIVATFLCTNGNSRGQMQIDKLENTTILSNIINSFNTHAIYNKILIILVIFYLIYKTIIFIKYKKIKKDEYMYISIMVIFIFGMLGFFSIKVPHGIAIHLLLIFSIFMLILYKNISNQKKIVSFVSSFIIIFIIVYMSLFLLKKYDTINNPDITRNYNITYNQIISLLQEADKNNLDTLIINKEDIEYNIGFTDDENYIWNRYLSMWAYRYGYTKKYIKIKFIENDI